MLQAFRCGDTLCAFDFDGTLAPIVQDREKAVLPEAIRITLSQLARQVPCAIVSGRSLKDLRGRVDGTVPYLIGNHGLEGPATMPVFRDRAMHVCAGWKAQLAEGSEAALRTVGAEIEDKTYSLSVHYRRTTRQAGAYATALTILQGLSPRPRLILGKAVINAMPPGSPHKGTALLGLMIQLQSHGAVYVGDDETDEDAFGVDRSMILGIRVGKNAASRASLYLNRQGETLRLLQYLVRHLDGDRNLNRHTPAIKAGHTL